MVIATTVAAFLRTSMISVQIVGIFIMCFGCMAH